MPPNTRHSSAHAALAADLLARHAQLPRTFFLALWAATGDPAGLDRHGVRSETMAALDKAELELVAGFDDERGRLANDLLTVLSGGPLPQDLGSLRALATRRDITASGHGWELLSTGDLEIAESLLRAEDPVLAAAALVVCDAQSAEIFLQTFHWARRVGADSAVWHRAHEECVEYMQGCAAAAFEHRPTALTCRPADPLAPDATAAFQRSLGRAGPSERVDLFAAADRLLWRHLVPVLLHPPARRVLKEEEQSALVEWALAHSRAFDIDEALAKDLSVENAKREHARAMLIGVTSLVTDEVSHPAHARLGEPDMAHGAATVRWVLDMRALGAFGSEQASVVGYYARHAGPELTAEIVGNVLRWLRGVRGSCEGATAARQAGNELAANPHVTSAQLHDLSELGCTKAQEELSRRHGAARARERREEEAPMSVAEAISVLRRDCYGRRAQVAGEVLRSTSDLVDRLHQEFAAARSITDYQDLVTLVTHLARPALYNEPTAENMAVEDVVMDLPVGLYLRRTPVNGLKEWAAPVSRCVTRHLGADPTRWLDFCAALERARSTDTVALCVAQVLNGERQIEKTGAGS